jgi:RAD51-like protein 2
VKLIVIDSVAFHFRHGTSSMDFGKRSRLLATMSQKLHELSHKSNLAVVLMNQMTTKVDDGGASGGGGGRLVPALGESWAHAATHRLQLYWAFDAAVSGERKAKLIKSSSKATNIVSYSVTKQGIRDVKVAPPPSQQSSVQLSVNSHQSLSAHSSSSSSSSPPYQPQHHHQQQQSRQENQYGQHSTPVERSVAGSSEIDAEAQHKRIRTD